MKTQNNFFKNVSKIVLIITILFATSCGSDDDGAVDAVDAFVTLPEPLLTTYTGNLVYTPVNGSLPTINTSGTATVALSGNTYTISFSDDVPSLTGLAFLVGDASDFVSATVGESTAGVSLDDGDLAVGVTMGGNNWAFSSN